MRVTTVVRQTSAEAWRAAEEKLLSWEGNLDRRVEANRTGTGSVGQQRLLDLDAQGEVLDRCLWTAPAHFGTGAASTWLVGSADEVVASLLDYVRLGLTHFILSDTPYREEAARVGDLVVARVRAAVELGTNR
jgi:alkanesulfonate monooxygenase